LSPLEEIRIECAMTQYQKTYYQSILSKNINYLTRGAHKSNNTNLMKIFMELRKVCNHTYLINGAEKQIFIERKALAGIPPDQEVSAEFVYQSLIRSAGKMILLDKLLIKLKEDGHRILILNQMTRMLDILQDYLIFKGYSFERLDGSIRGEDRQTYIDRFNQSHSQVLFFCYQHMLVVKESI
jgi:SNF2 family DNA or RNA helicase